MRLIPFFSLLALASSLPLHALDIAGYVLDKAGNPIAGAKVCVKSDANSCVNTGARGDFHLAKAIAIRKQAPGHSGYDLAYRKGALMVRSPSAGPARLEWLSADGRRAWASSEIELTAGPNPVPLPSGLPHAGVLLLRLSTQDQSLAWKAVLASPAGNAGNPGSGGKAEAAGPTAIAALSKAAAATLEVSKAGYRTRSYEPASETETEAYIFLSLTSDAGLVFTGSFSRKVISIDHAKKSITTESVDASCDPADATRIIRDTVAGTQKYAIRDGQLWTWYDKECVGQQFSGTAADIVGKWTMIDPSALLPADLRVGCIEDSSYSEESPFETFSAEYTVTESLITGAVTAETCPGDYLGSLFALMFSGDTLVTTTKNTCQQVAFKNGKGEPAAFDFSRKTDYLHTAYGYGAKACAMDMDFGLNDKDPACPQGKELSDFLDCVTASGFSEAGPLAKQAGSALPRGEALPRVAAPALVRLPKRGWLPRNTPRGEEYISGVWKAAAPRR